MLHHFADHGVPGPDGLLPLGWYGEFLPMVQTYSGPGSPYWAAKGFLGLLLPPDHPVWQDPELPLPAESCDGVRALPGPNWLVQWAAADGLVRVHNHGSDGLHAGSRVSDDPHYNRLAYSTSTAPRTVSGPPPDTQIWVGATAGRGRIQPLGVAVSDGIGWVASAHSPAPDVRIETHVVAFGAWEVRLHVVDAPAECGIHESGYNVSDPASPTRSSPRLTSHLSPLHGYSDSSMDTGTDLDAMGSSSAVSVLSGTHPGGRALFASVATLSGSPVPRDLPLRLEIDGPAISLHLPGDITRSWLLGSCSVPALTPQRP